MSPRQILTLGWLGAFLYAYPGYMSFDSIAQLQQARWDYFRDDHPPAMAALWQLVEVFVTGPAGMLVLQLTAFLAGTYLLLRTKLAPRTAAIAASLILIFPPVLNTMSVIWKDSQMAAYLVLGTAFLLSPRRGVRIGGLAFLALATAMRHNALAMTLPIVFVLFAWNDTHRWWKRYAIAFAAWIAITMSARVASNAMSDQTMYMWHRSLALLDIVGTLRYAEDIPDEKLREQLAGTRLRYERDLQQHTRDVIDPKASPTDQLWDTTNKFFLKPWTEEERAAVSRAWKTVVLAHPVAYAKYRWVVFSQLTQVDDTPLGSPIYCWFTDIQDLWGSGQKVDHAAGPSWIQSQLQRAMFWLGDTPIFHVSLWLIVALLLIPFAVRDRLSLGLVGSALVSQATLFLLAPTVDVRYSFWLVVTTAISVVLVVGIRSNARRPAQRSSSPRDTS